MVGSRIGVYEIIARLGEGGTERLAEPQCTDPLDPSGGIVSSISISASGSSSGS